MRPFLLERAGSVVAAGELGRRAMPEVDSEAQFLAGGTVLLDLMKLDVMRPAVLVDIADLAADYGQITVEGGTLVIGALARMAQVAADPMIRLEYPMLAAALEQAASPQLRNMASIAGTVLQKTRCSYFRDTSWPACNRRSPGTGCAALTGVNRRHAVLGVSDDCIATYPGDFATALAALDTRVEIIGADGVTREIGFEALHRRPGSTPARETGLRQGDLITRFMVPGGAWHRSGVYVKVRDRSSYEYALTAAAVALEVAPDGVVREARIGLGGVATVPWRAREAEAVLVGGPVDPRRAAAAAEAAFAQAVTHGGNDFKPELGRRTLLRAVLAAARGEAHDAAF